MKPKPQHQDQQPGIEKKMDPPPIFLRYDYQGSNKLKGKVALITGGDSGIGRAVAWLFAREGADIFFTYLNEEEDAKETKAFIEAEGRHCEMLNGNIADQNFCREVLVDFKNCFDHLDILINNSAQQYPQEKLEDITKEQLHNTFAVNFFSYFYITQFALPLLKSGASIINSTSVVAYRGSKELIDYSSTKGAIVSFTRSLSLSLMPRGIRVNAVAPGPVWTPLIPSSFSAQEVGDFGQSVPMKRVGQPAEIAPAYLFLAAEDSSYITGQVIHPNGGVIING